MIDLTPIQDMHSVIITIFAQVAIEQTQTPVHKNGKWKDCHGDRVKIRIPAMHPMSSTDDAYQLTDDQLPWAIVAKPTTHGNYNHQSCGLHGGEWVLGYLWMKSVKFL